MAKLHKNKRLKKRFEKKSKKKASTSRSSQALSQEQSLQVEAKRKGGWYQQHYKKLLLIPFIMLLAAFVIIGVQVAQTGDFVQKGISLKGGTAITLTSDMADLEAIDTSTLEEHLRTTFSQADVSIRTQKNLNEVVAIEIETDLTQQEDLDAFKGALVDYVPELTLEEANQNVQNSGSTLGDNFFKQIIKALIIAFVLMGIVVFIQFRVPVPSLAVILAAFSDIVVTLAVVNVLGIKLSTAGIAAFLMLIGYSVDTDILLSTRVLKNKEGTIHQRIRSALKTGLTMNITTLCAVSVALIFSQSQTITQIMTILFIGLLVDMINTWLQNVGILRWYVEKREAKGGMKK